MWMWLIWSYNLLLNSKLISNWIWILKWILFWRNNMNVLKWNWFWSEYDILNIKYDSLLKCKRINRCVKWSLVVKETGASYWHTLCQYWNHFNNCVRGGWSRMKCMVLAYVFWIWRKWTMMNWPDTCVNLKWLKQKPCRPMRLASSIRHTLSYYRHLHYDWLVHTIREE